MSAFPAFTLKSSKNVNVLVKRGFRPSYTHAWTDLKKMLQENAANEIRNESDEVRQRLKFAIKIIFFDATMGSKNYTICKIHMRNIFPTD